MLKFVGFCLATIFLIIVATLGLCAVWIMWFGTTYAIEEYKREREEE